MSIAFYKKLRNALNLGEVLYTTRNNVDYTFDRWDTDGALRFKIPSRTIKNKRQTKFIPKEVLESNIEPTFIDCRKSVFTALHKTY